MSYPVSREYLFAQRAFARYELNYRLQEGLCFYCRQAMSLPLQSHQVDGLPPDRVTREHLLTQRQHRNLRRKLIAQLPVNSAYYRRTVMPRRHAPGNIVAACYSCNNKRSNHYSWQEFLLLQIEERWAPK